MPQRPARSPKTSSWQVPCHCRRRECRKRSGGPPVTQSPPPPSCVRGRERLEGEGELFPLWIEPDVRRAATLERTEQDGVGELRLHVVFDDARERTSTHQRIVPLVGEVRERRVVDHDLHLAVCEQL